MADTISSDSLRRKSSSSSSSNDVDIVDQINGCFGRWQLRTILLIFLCKIPTAWFMACIIYTAPYPRKGELVCRPAGWNASQSQELLEEHTEINTLLSEERSTDRLFNVDVCSAYALSLTQGFVRRYGQEWNTSSRDTDSSHLPCEKVEHTTAYKSLITQFDLICSRRVLVAVTQSFHALGALVGGLLAYKALFSGR